MPNIKIASVASLCACLPLLCSASTFSFSARGKTYDVTVTTRSSSGLGFAGHWLYEASVILPSSLTSNQYVLLFASNTTANTTAFPTGEAIYMQTSNDGLSWGAPTQILTKGSNICDMIDARPIWDGSLWHVYVQADQYTSGGTNCDEHNLLYEATGSSLTSLSWYGTGGVPLGSDAGTPGIGEDHQWFNTANYNGPSGYPILDFYNAWNFTSPDYTYCPTCAGNGTDMFAYLSAAGVPSFYFWYYTSPSVAQSDTAGGGYLFMHPDVLLGGTAGQSTLGAPGFAFSNDCSSNSQYGRGLGFFPTPVPNNTSSPSLPGQFIAGTFASSTADHIISTRLARNPYGFLDTTSSSPNTWTTFLYYNIADERNGTRCLIPRLQDTFRNNGSSGNPTAGWGVSQVTITEQ